MIKMLKKAGIGIWYYRKKIKQNVTNDKTILLKEGLLKLTFNKTNNSILLYT